MGLFLSPAILTLIHNGFSTIPFSLYVMSAPFLWACHLLSLFSLTVSLGQMQSEQDTQAPFLLCSGTLRHAVWGWDGEGCCAKWQPLLCSGHLQLHELTWLSVDIKKSRTSPLYGWNPAMRLAVEFPWRLFIIMRNSSIEVQNPPHSCSAFEFLLGGHRPEV